MLMHEKNVAFNVKFSNSLQVPSLKLFDFDIHDLFIQLRTEFPAKTYM